MSRIRNTGCINPRKKILKSKKVIFKVPVPNKTLCDKIKRHPKGRKNVREIFTAPQHWSLPVNCQTTPGRWSRKYVEEFVTGQAEKRYSLLQLSLIAV
jgi:hypothetical protein